MFDDPLKTFAGAIGLWNYTFDQNHYQGVHRFHALIDGFDRK